MPHITGTEWEKMQEGKQMSFDEFQKSIIDFLKDIDIVDYRITKGELETVIDTSLSERKEFREKYNIEINGLSKFVSSTSNKQSDSDL